LPSPATQTTRLGRGENGGDKRDETEENDKKEESDARRDKGE